MSRLVIDVSAEQHQQIKALAALSGKSIKDFVMQKLFFAEADEEAAFKELKEILLARMKDAKKETPSTKSIRDIAREDLANG